MLKSILVRFVPAALAIAVALVIYTVGMPRTGAPVAQAGQPASPNTQTESQTPMGISVSGAGKVSVKPNIAMATMGVDITTASLAQATTQANTKMAAVIAKLKSMGVEDKDIQTVNYNVYPITQAPKSPDGSGTPTITGYHVTNQVRVIVRKIDDLGKILDAAVGAGANSVLGVSFGVDDLTPFQKQARAAAVKDAQDKASQLAQAANVQLGSVLAISEFTQSGPRPLAATADMSVRGASQVPVETGEMDIVVNVDMRFAIK